MREKLAALCHSQWSGWMDYLFSKGTRNPDGTFTLPKEFVDRWTRQMEAPFYELSESEQDSDRKEADKFLALIRDYGQGHDALGQAIEAVRLLNSMVESGEQHTEKSRGIVRAALDTYRAIPLTNRCTRITTPEKPPMNWRSSSEPVSVWQKVRSIDC